MNNGIKISVWSITTLIIFYLKQLIKLKKILCIKLSGDSALYEEQLVFKHAKPKKKNITFKHYNYFQHINYF